MPEISVEIAEKKYGISTIYEEMDNGELRFRLKSNDGSSYIKTISGKKGAWQNSHYHKDIKEIFIIQNGWMAIARLIETKLLINICKQGEIVTIDRNVIHNIYLSKNTITHTVKYGGKIRNDWFPDENFDKITKILTEKELIQIAK